MKPVLDRGVALIALVLLAPLLAAIAVLIRLEDGGPAFFRQVRSGAEGATFSILKFRTYPMGTPQAASAAAADLKPTRTGRLLRRWSLDELPQLTNVLRGEMSLVGPRPALPTQHDVIEGRRLCHAHRLRPGMTGLAQIRSYDGMTSDEKVAWDCTYVTTISLATDARIVLSTVGYLFRTPPTY